MKKSEKIEIRISHEEKEKLSRLAESEGRSVSELVRDLAKKYALLNMPNPRRRLSMLAVAGFILCGLGIGVGTTLSMTDRTSSWKKSHYMVHGQISENGFGFNLEDGFEAKIGQGNGTYQINVSINENDKKGFAYFSVCQWQDQECISEVSAELELNDDSAPSVWQAKTKSGDPLFLVVQPVFVS